MERLLPISRPEWEMIHIFSSADDMFEGEPGYHRKFSPEEQEVVYRQRERQFPALHTFLKAIVPVGYHDLHGDNVMHTAEGQYKLIDLETLIHIGVDGRYIFPC